VGYTNAGKSTLFNYITAANVYAQDQLFATLDPTMRRIQLPSIGAAVLADTVGFISHLPHRLVEAFRATLEEAASADVLLHVIDAAAEERSRNIEQVEQVLKEIGASELPQLRVYNKIDLLDEPNPRIDRDDQGMPVAVWLSAHSGEGVELLFDAVAELLGQEWVQKTLYLQPDQARLRAKLYASNAVNGEQYADNGTIELDINIQKTDLLRILSQEQLEFDALSWQA
jgi:GTP-binding protein HflX